ncbi:hypothetical protein LDX50_23080 [Fulvivirga sp. 1062]|uniref:Uncharacterized protein n=2 Tax=Fulvivirga sedimenti TaxID=2879465 RepID=A0A9X1HQQ8_9BACT|nr:hypothetical protein [Fulvivirga sedimenti]MCA6076652.1 hypothetical protein [Fulvivirga sedimenti]MCA6077780.1 hypothetical protein [Fulvivirga sedimenti]
MKPAERRYFNVWASRNGSSEKKFILLFNGLSEQTEYDEEALLNSIPDISPTQISNLKAHLYQRVLQCMRQYSQSHSLEIQIREMIDHVQILFNRGLYDQCVQILKKARKKVGSIDNLELQLEILKWEKNILTQTVGAGNEQRVNRIVREVQQVNERINNVNKFTNLAARLNAIYYRIGFIRNQSDYNHIQRLFEKELPDFIEQELSLTEKLSLYQLLSGYYSFIQDFDSGLKYARKWLDLFDEHKEIRYSRTNDYLSAINTLMIAQYKMYSYDDFVETSRRLREIRHYPRHTMNENIRMRLYKYTYVHEFNRIFMLGDFGHGVSLIEKIEPLLEPFIRQLDNHSRIILFYKVACLYFGDQKYGNCIRWLNRIFTSENIDLREDIHSFARILSLISHYELGNTDVIDYYIRSTYRFLLRKKDLYSFQKYILSFLKKLDAHLSEEELMEAFNELRDQLVPLQHNPYERRAFMYFDIISWLESKSNNHKVGEIIHQKAMRRIARQRTMASENQTL